MKKNFKQLYFLLLSLIGVGLLAISCKPIPPKVDDIPDSQWDTTVQQVLQYCDTVKANTAGASNGPEVYEQSAAVMFKADKIAAYKNNRMIKISVALATDSENQATDYSNLRVWVRQDLNGRNLAEATYNGTITLGEWHDVTLSPYLRLNEPFTDLYVGYTITSNGSPILGDGSRDPNANASYIYDNDMKKWIKYPTIGNLLISCTVAGPNMPQYDVELQGVRTARFTKPGAKFDVAAKIYNRTEKVVTSFDFTVKAGETEIYNTIIDLPNPIGKDDSYPFFVKDLSIEKGGIYDVQYIVSAVNGQNDDNMMDNVIVVKTDVSESMKDKVVFLENFTTQQCNNCARAHEGVQNSINALGGNEKFAWICQHAGYNTDNFTNAHNDSACTFFGSSSTFAPALNLDRVPLGNVGTYFGVHPQYAFGPTFNLNGHIEEFKNLTDFMAVMQKNMAPVDLNVTYDFNNETRVLTCTVEGTVLSSVLATKNLAVGVITLENGLIGFQNGHAGDYTHNHVVRDCLTSIFGKSVKVNNDGTFTLSVSKQINSKYKPENMDVVVWVADKPENFNFMKHYNDCEVHQAYVAKMIK